MHIYIYVCICIYVYATKYTQATHRVIILHSLAKVIGVGSKSIAIVVVLLFVCDVRVVVCIVSIVFVA